MTERPLVHDHAEKTEPCAGFPELVRMNYFHGQMLGPRDFLTEQAYHRAKQLLINRCLHGYGVVCGLQVLAVPGEAPCPDPASDAVAKLDAAIAGLRPRIAELESRPGQEPKIAKLEGELEELYRKREQLNPTQQHGPNHGTRSREQKVKLSRGFALDPSGHEIVVSHDVILDLSRYLTEADRKALASDDCGLLYLSLCHAECGFESVRPAALDACQIVASCQDARIREGYRLRLSSQPPEVDQRCEPCCSGSCDTCVLLATIRLRRGVAITPHDIDNHARRPFGLYAPTVITGVNWLHGETYTPSDAEALLGTDSNHGGLEVRFSRPIQVSTVRPGVVDLWSIAGGRGVAGPITHITGKFVDLPAAGMVDRILYRDTTDERPRPGDRIMLTVRCDFLLDACGRPVDGNHVGGRVPKLGHTAHWTSGNGVPGGSFESWFFIERSKEPSA